MIIYNFIKNLMTHLKYCKLLNKVYKDEHILENLSALFKVEFKKDWIGRIYAVFNPYLKEGIYDRSNQIFEYNENGWDDTTYIKSYIFNMLNISKQYIRATNLFDLLTYEIKKIDEYDNYLFIIQPITWVDLKLSIKKMIYLLAAALILGGFSLYLLC